MSSQMSEGLFLEHDLIHERVQIFCFLFPSSSLGTQLCRSSSLGEAVPKRELGNEGKSFTEPAGMAA